MLPCTVTVRVSRLITDPLSLCLGCLLTCLLLVYSFIVAIVARIVLLLLDD